MLVWGYGAVALCRISWWWCQLSHDVTLSYGWLLADPPGSAGHLGRARAPGRPVRGHPAAPTRAAEPEWLGRTAYGVTASVSPADLSGMGHTDGNNLRGRARHTVPLCDRAWRRLLPPGLSAVRRREGGAAAHGPAGQSAWSSRRPSAVLNRAVGRSRLASVDRAQHGRLQGTTDDLADSGRWAGDPVE